MNKINSINSNKYINILDCNDYYKTLEETVIDELCNGCGTGWNVDLVPDRILINFSICCNIHDLDYNFGKNRKESDKRLKYNMQRIAENIYNKETKKLSWLNFSDWNNIIKAKAKRKTVYILSNIYYAFVKEFGQSAWDKGHRIKDIGNNVRYNQIFKK